MAIAQKLAVQLCGSCGNPVSLMPAASRLISFPLAIFCRETHAIRFPSLVKEGVKRPQAAAGWFESSRKNQACCHFTATTRHPMALRCHFPSSSEEGSFSAIFPFRDRNWLDVAGVDGRVAD